MSFKCPDCEELFTKARINVHIIATGHCNGDCTGSKTKYKVRPTTSEKHGKRPIQTIPTRQDMSNIKPQERRNVRSDPVVLQLSEDVCTPSLMLHLTYEEMNKFDDEVGYSEEHEGTDEERNKNKNEDYEESKEEDDIDEIMLNWKEGDNKVFKENIDTKLGQSQKIEESSLLKLEKYFFNSVSVSTQDKGVALADGVNAPNFLEASLFGQLVDDSHAKGDITEQQKIFLNTNEPFCLVTVGIQGGGKSHTLASVLEGCLIPHPELEIVRLNKPMTCLVLHYDQSATSRCEATGLRTPSTTLQAVLGNISMERCVSKERMTILVSPSYYKQRKAFYGDYCNVKPLLLKWNSLTADHIKSIMRLKDSDNQLYAATMLELLRRYQRQIVMPSLTTFFEQVKLTCNVRGQSGPLDQRIALFESLIAESETNSDIRDEGCDLYAACQPGHLVVCDLTDPLLSSLEVNGIFQVLVEQYRTLHLPRGCGRLLALDEVHKFMDSEATDGLSSAIVNIARLMRHDGIRLVVSTQSPLTLAPELLELVTVAVLHRFHSKDWFSYLSQKLPLEAEAWDLLVSLNPGQALVFASRHQIIQGRDNCKYGRNCFVMQIRPRLTADRGSTIVNNKTNPSISTSVSSNSINRRIG